MRCVAVINQKGGVGKTTTTVNIGAAFANAGNKVLLLDIDPQANLTLHLDRRPEGDTPTMTDLLVEQAALRDMICDTGTEGLYMVPADTSLSGVESQLANRIGREMILREALEQIEAEGCPAVPGGRFDYVFLDCPPSLGVLSANALVAAEHVIIPMQAEYFSMQGMTKLMEVMGLVRKSLNPTIEICLILPCMVDRRTNLSNEVLSELRRHFGDVLATTCIRSNVKLAEAPSFGRTIFEHAPDSNGARDYQIVADELLRRLQGTFEPERMEEPEEEVEAVELIVADESPADESPAGDPTESPIEPPSGPAAEPAAEPTPEPRREDLESEFAVAVSYMAEVSGESAYVPEPLRREASTEGVNGTTTPVAETADDPPEVPTTATPPAGDQANWTHLADPGAAEAAPAAEADSPAADATSPPLPDETVADASPAGEPPQAEPTVGGPQSPPAPATDADTATGSVDALHPAGRGEVSTKGAEPEADPDRPLDASGGTPPADQPDGGAAGSDAHVSADADAGAEVEVDAEVEPQSQERPVTIPTPPNLSEEATVEDPLSADSTLQSAGPAESAPRDPDGGAGSVRTV